MMPRNMENNNEHYLLPLVRAVAFFTVVYGVLGAAVALPSVIVGKGAKLGGELEDYNAREALITGFVGAATESCFFMLSTLGGMYFSVSRRDEKVIDEHRLLNSSQKEDTDFMKTWTEGLVTKKKAYNKKEGEMLGEIMWAEVGIAAGTHGWVGRFILTMVGVELTMSSSTYFLASQTLFFLLPVLIPKTKKIIDKMILPSIPKLPDNLFALYSGRLVKEVYGPTPPPNPSH